MCGIFKRHNQLIFYIVSTLNKETYNGISSAIKILLSVPSAKGPSIRVSIRNQRQVKLTSVTWRKNFPSSHSCPFRVPLGAGFARRWPLSLQNPDFRSNGLIGLGNCSLRSGQSRYGAKRTKVGTYSRLTLNSQFFPPSPTVSSSQNGEGNLPEKPRDMSVSLEFISRVIIFN